VDEEKTSIVTEWLCKYVSVPTETDTTVEELLEKKHATTEELSFLCGLP
jgi:hypothetical protein